jgi:hypothetical protein
LEVQTGRVGELDVKVRRHRGGATRSGRVCLYRV